jgi:hypothetical protein
MKNSLDSLRHILRSGCDLTINYRLSLDVLRELAELARESGAKLTVTTDTSFDAIVELTTLAGKHIAFTDSK